MTVKGLVPVLYSLKSATTGLCGEAHVSVLNFYHEFAEQYPPNIIKTHEGRN